jgi:hypothetical protein
MPPRAPEIMWSFSNVNRTNGTLDVPVHGVYAEWPAEFARIADRRNAESRGEPWGRIALYSGDKILVQGVAPEAVEQVKATLAELVGAASAPVTPRSEIRRRQRLRSAGAMPRTWSAASARPDRRVPSGPLEIRCAAAGVMPATTQ